ncbi:neutral zinc metallopeptidase [Kribbella sp. NPDC056861]|uniref:neutral zinc metallopeptidase n=1 Tax=Kribbella sp. NPDC056861 TaxID=3154857 RepID=UPI003437C1F1
MKRPWAAVALLVAAISVLYRLPANGGPEWTVLADPVFPASVQLLPAHCGEPVTKDMKAFGERMLDCLASVWGPVVQQTDGLVMRRPDVVVYWTAEIPTRCGVVRDTTAYYCGAGAEVIYLSGPAFRRLFSAWPADSRSYATLVLAHEYGHHLQNQLGIMKVSTTRQSRLSGAAAEEESRRRELQASCWAAAFLGADRVALGPGFASRWRSLLSRTGDLPGTPRLHGSVASNRYWAQLGFADARPGSCRTFTATRAMVE